MHAAVLGTGVVGRTLAHRLDGLGHRVTVGTRDVTTTHQRIDSAGGFSMADWLAAHPGIELRELPLAAESADIVILAVNGAAALETLVAVGAQHLAGKTLLDVTNPLDFSSGFPPTLLIKDNDSLAEQIQRAFPDTRVVKTLNTVTADVMVHPDKIGDGGTSVFVSGDDPAAKERARELLVEMGWRDVIDLGDIATARGPEMYLPLWLRLMASQGTPLFNIAVVR